ncbi:cobalt-zinc-cadmium resistance protein CzcA [Rhodothalassium salexigens DSM 2132]|uniref:Cobalt-zinc-cadmium resistance protein CzcA n=1 Tax=Rhodothalassium salexigens DSM 2132 TaxID=1188247 RepID=A0A4R2PRM9_RHOSA|nr:CusA/CzcA family heavy metal efflux RND transporter [Rhodothalassium salexigens]MBB4210740.1 cobalt-zinc-cadmium resistance protein CzcA [Rhodothalassium salexigens DSM 2132]MBK1638279.1 CusA/CzcA family heavy metal efflux RND transporter [Rhodothalassium salexigens DSM 2132]TCP37704.1 cobalt-zinc-cadmium resistance protein CzcA [Rhodothalassium salexigens DSM 2132]
MLTRLVQFSLTQRLLLMLLAGALLAGGWWSYRNTPIDAYPDVSTPQIKIIMKAPGMTPEEVEERITGPLEREMLGIPRVNLLRSTTKYALADITIDFTEGTDIYWARTRVEERLTGIRGDLPAGVEGGVAPLTTPLGEMFMFTIQGGDLSLTERRTLLDWVIRPALRGVKGVADVNALGGKAVTYEVSPIPARMEGTGTTYAELRAALAANNRNDGAGRIDDGEETLLVRTQGAVTTLEDIRRIVIRADPAEPLRVGDVADVRFGHLTRYGGVTRDGVGEAVEGLVLGLRGANAREVVAGVEAQLETLQQSLPDGVEIRVFYNRGDLVERAVGMITEALLEAVVLVILLLMVFLGDWRAALTVALVLPLAAMATFILMHTVGLSANLMSLGGLAIAIGLLVDAAIVVVENSATKLRDQGQSGLPRLHLLYRAATEVAAPVTAGIGIIIVVFLPLLSLQGLEGKLFRPVAITIVFALASALVLALTVIPVVGSFLLRPGGRDPWLVRRLHALYRPSLRLALGHGRLVIGGALGLLAVAGLLFTQVGKTFMPTMDEGNLIVQLQKQPSITLDQSLDIDLSFQRALLAEVPEVTGTVARTGSDEIGLDPMGLNETDTFLELAPRDQWTVASKDALIDRIRTLLDRFPGVATTFTQPIQMRVDEMLTGVRGDLAIKIFGDDPAALSRVAQRVVDVVAQVPGAADVYTPTQEGQQYLRLTIDRMAAGRLGLGVDQVADVLRAQLEGLDVGTIYLGNRRLPMQIKTGGDMATSPVRLESLRITLPDHRAVPLGRIVAIERVEGPVAIARERGSRLAYAIANVSGRDLVGFVEDAQAAVASQVDLPTGYYLEWGGEFENQQRAAKRLMVVVPIALGLIFLILFSTLGSVRQAVLVLSNIPLALVGGVVALAITGEYLSVPASVGFIALLGIAVMNGVVMITHFNHLADRGWSLDRLVQEGAERRLRPVLMTASITAFGLIPLALASGPGSEVQRPLAIVVIGGVISSTLLTLIILPILYRRFGVKTATGVKGALAHD